MLDVKKNVVIEFARRFGLGTQCVKHLTSEQIYNRSVTIIPGLILRRRASDRIMRFDNHSKSKCMWSGPSIRSFGRIPATRRKPHSVALHLDFCVNTCVRQALYIRVEHATCAHTAACFSDHPLSALASLAQATHGAGLLPSFSTTSSRTTSIVGATPARYSTHHTQTRRTRLWSMYI